MDPNPYHSDLLALFDGITKVEEAARHMADKAGRGPQGLALNALATSLYTCRCVAFALTNGSTPSL